MVVRDIVFWWWVGRGFDGLVFWELLGGFGGSGELKLVLKGFVGWL